jgi:hypothetical protein
MIQAPFGLKRSAVQAMALARGWRAVVEDVPQMTSAPAAVHLRTHGEQAAVDRRADGIG